MSVSVAWAKASSEPTPRRDNLGGLEKHVNHPWPGSSRGSQLARWPSPGKLVQRVLSEERGKCCSPRPSCGYSRATPRDATHYLNCRRCQPSQSQTRTSLPLPLGPLSASETEAWRGRRRSSCSHPREAMNLFLARRISWRNRTASLVQRAIFKHFSALRTMSVPEGVPGILVQSA